MERLLHRKYSDQNELRSATEAKVHLSRINPGYSNERINEVRQEIDLRQLLDKIIRNQRVVNKNHSVEINVNIRTEAPFISDKMQVEMVLNNLISNTIRSQSIGTIMPYVFIKMHSHRSGINILIRDNTFRVKKEAFKIFQMLSFGRKKSEKFGLELYVVKQTIEKLHGRIEVKVELEEGTEYNIHLPNLYQ